MLLLEETGWAGLPHPFVETVAVAAPLLAGDAGDAQTRQVPAPPACPTPTDSAWWRPSSAARTWPARPTPTALLLRDPAAGTLHLVDPAAVVLTPVDTVDGARRAAIVDWQPAPETVVTDDPATVALALRPRGARHGRPAGRARASACSTSPSPT